MAMKITFRNERSEDIKGKHNDRNFDVKRSSHITEQKIDEDFFYTYKDGFYSGSERLDHMSFRETEINYYKEQYGKFLALQNYAYMAKSMHDRVKTPTDLYEGQKTKPEDIILQIGTINEHATKEELLECTKRYIEWFNKEYGSNCKILSVALHVDEDNHAPHVHIRRIWEYEDDRGIKKIGQGKALEQLGIEKPNPFARTDRYNNAKTTFTKIERDKIIDICDELGLDIVNNPKKAKHLKSKDYNRAYEEGKQHAMENSDAWIWQNMLFENGYDKDACESYKKKQEERLRAQYKLLLENNLYNEKKMAEIYPSDVEQEMSDNNEKFHKHNDNKIQ